MQAWRSVINDIFHGAVILEHKSVSCFRKTSSSNFFLVGIFLIDLATSFFWANYINNIINFVTHDSRTLKLRDKSQKNLEVYKWLLFPMWLRPHSEFAGAIKAAQLHSLCCVFHLLSWPACELLMSIHFSSKNMVGVKCKHWGKFLMIQGFC